MAYSQAQIIGIIEQVANQQGVSPATAVATSSVETGGSFNPNDVGDNGTSFGLFQLHKGGELGSLTPQQAFNPTTNATVALSHMAAVQAQNPNLSPGALAAAAQRPANPAAYASEVNALVAQYGGSSPTTSTTSTTTANTSAPTPVPITSGVRGLTLNPVTDINKFTSFLVSHVLDSVFIVTGVALLVVGLVVLFKGTRAAESGAGTFVGSAVKAP